MQWLTKQQITELAAMIGETDGRHLTNQQFADALTALFEDISGLETLPPASARLYIKTGWRIYRERARQ